MKKALYDRGVFFFGFLLFFVFLVLLVFFFFVVLRNTRDRAEAVQTLVLKGALYCTVLVFFCICHGEK